MAAYQGGMQLNIRRKLIVALGAGALTTPLGSFAQQLGKKNPRIGVLWHAGNAEEEAPYFGAFIEGLRALGYSEGRATLDHRFANENPELFKSMAAELVSSKPDVLVGVGGAAPYLVKATSMIPVVFIYVPDPVGSGLVTSIRQPGGNATGLSNFSLELSAKRLQCLKELIPTLTRVGLLVNPDAKISDLYIAQSRAAALKLGLSTQAFPVRSLGELDATFDAMVSAGMQAVVVNAESLFYKGKDAIAKLAIARRLPTCVWVKELVDSGALISYGVDQQAIARRAATYVDKILKGSNPAGLPVEQPTTFEMFINGKTAKTLGIKISNSILVQATKVIE
jgi:putative ABC transport system substrate-binding protein